MPTALKSGAKTTEFWLVLLTNVLPEVGAIDVGGPKGKGLLHALTIIGYAISRGLAKMNAPKDGTTPTFSITGPEAEVPGGGFPPVEPSSPDGLAPVAPVAPVSPA